MEEELKKVLKENLEVSQESLKILKGIRRNQRISATFRVLYWIVILGSAIGAYYYLQPYIDKAFRSYGQIQDTISNIQKQYMPR